MDFWAFATFCTFVGWLIGGGLGAVCGFTLAYFIAVANE